MYGSDFANFLTPKIPFFLSLSIVISSTRFHLFSADAIHRAPEH